MMVIKYLNAFKDIIIYSIIITTMAQLYDSDNSNDMAKFICYLKKTTICLSIMTIGYGI